MNPRLPRMNDVRVLVVGDVILDRYWHGSARRISPEAPVPVVRVEDVVERVGGAANVAANVAALGAQARLCGVVGDDADGRALTALCAEQGITASLVRSAHQPTIVKLRVVSQHQQLVRLDFERAPHATDAGAVVKAVAALLTDVDIVVLSDYAKGALGGVGELIELARAAGKPIVVDPKGTDFARYAGATILTPNLHEFEAVVGPCADEVVLEHAARALLARHTFGAVLVTRGEHGMTLVTADGGRHDVAARAQDVFDVTGAGDTVCGVLATVLAAGLPLPLAVDCANAAAGLVVGKFGAATVGAVELATALTPSAPVPRGVLTHGELIAACAAARGRGERLVMTNGCFDLLHAGHVRYLEAARALGDRLIVAVNDDASVAALKGRGRPLNPLGARTSVLAALACVDWVVAFDGDTPRALIAEVLPDVLVKGGDYRVDDIAGAAEVRAAGGEVLTLEYHAGHSTSGLVAAALAGAGEGL